MKAVVLHRAHDLRIEERDAGTPGPGEVLIAIRRGGICGSDLHYYGHGGIGAIRVREPIVLGHEVAGEIAALGPGVADLSIGDVVAVNPSLACGLCVYCQRGAQQHCLDMRFFGSAMRMPHVQGAFQQEIIVGADRCHRIDAAAGVAAAAFCEPFAVALHGIARAGPLIGRKVLVTGCGPIGALAIVAARVHGAQEIFATDVTDFTLQKALEMGADRVANVGCGLDGLADMRRDKGQFDVMIEASGNASAFRTGLECLRPGGILVQLGLGGDVAMPQNLIVSKEIEVRGSFRFHAEFALAADLINRGRVDLMPLLTEVIGFEDAERAMENALDRNRAMKVQLAF